MEYRLYKKLTEDQAWGIYSNLSPKKKWKLEKLKNQGHYISTSAYAMFIISSVVATGALVIKGLAGDLLYYYAVLFLLGGIYFLYRAHSNVMKFVREEL